ncbi:MAG: hypothetical protein JKX88_04500 [Marinicaulis sp.]|nr:hypothetical protein [Marinicaulis sp.]
MTRSIERLYEVFSNVPKPKEIDYCPCCMTGEEIEILLSLPLKALPEDVVGNYCGCAFHTVGGAAEYHYFFPRLLELRLTDLGFWPDYEIILGNLKLASWREWPHEQRDAVISVVNECFEVLLKDANEFDSFEIEGIICGVARSGLAIDGYLQKLESSQYNDTLRYFVAHALDVTSDDGFLEGFWGDVPAAAKELVAWLNKQSAAHPS